MSNQPLPSNTPRLLSFPKLESEFGIGYSRVHIDRLEKAGDFPPRVQIGAGRVAWLETEIVSWIAARAAARSGA